MFDVELRSLSLMLKYEAESSKLNFDWRFIFERICLKLKQPAQEVTIPLPKVELQMLPRTLTFETKNGMVGSHKDSEMDCSQKFEL